MTEKDLEQLLQTAGELDDLVYALQGTEYEYILEEAEYDYDEIIYKIQDILKLN